MPFQPVAEPTTEAEVAGSLQRYIAEAILLAPSARPDTAQSLFDSGLIDSASFLMIVGFIEDRFAVVVDGDDLEPENFATIDAIAALVAAKCAAASGRSAR